MNKKEKDWISALKIITQILEQDNLAYFLDMGTLLGAVRDQSFIPWDNDIDIGVTPQVDLTQEYIKSLS